MINSSVFIQTLKSFLKIIVAVDPCKKCIVRVSCSQECDSRKNFLMLTDGMPYLMKVCVVTILTSLIFIMYSAYKTIVEILHYYFKF
jgi:hypothetical protein